MEIKTQEIFKNRWVEENNREEGNNEE